ncbi:MAG: hypothetical protein AABM32_03955 [Chloroflexota bacterium]
MEQLLLLDRAADAERDLDERDIVVTLDVEELRVVDEAVASVILAAVCAVAASAIFRRRG